MLSKARATGAVLAAFALVTLIWFVESITDGQVFDYEET